MSPHRLRRAALHLPLRRSERGLLYFHHGLLAARQQRRQAKVGRVRPDRDGPALLTVTADRVYLPGAGIIGTKHYFPAVGCENGITNALQTCSRREQYLLLPVQADEARRLGRLEQQHAAIQGPHDVRNRLIIHASLAGAVGGDDENAGIPGIGIGLCMRDVCQGSSVGRPGGAEINSCAVRQSFTSPAIGTYEIDSAVFSHSEADCQTSAIRRPGGRAIPS